MRRQYTVGFKLFGKEWAKSNGIKFRIGLCVKGMGQKPQKDKANPLCSAVVTAMPVSAIQIPCQSQNKGKKSLYYVVVQHT